MNNNFEDFYIQMDNSDAYLCVAAFQLQQALELTLKYIVMINGLEPTTEHRLHPIIWQLHEAGIIIPQELEILRASLYVDFWYNTARFDPDCYVTRHEFTRIVSILEELMKFAESCPKVIRAF